MPLSAPVLLLALALAPRVLALAPPTTSATPAPAPGTAPPAEGAPTESPADGSTPAGAPEGGEPPEGESPEGRAAETPAAAPAPLMDPAEVERLRAEARSLRDDLFEARARVSSVTAKLFRSKVTIELRSNVERFYEVRDFTLSLDGAPVYFKESGLAPTKTSLVEAYAAPGTHQLELSARLTAKRSNKWRTDVRQSFTIVVPEGGQLRTRFVLVELGNMFGKFDKRGKGKHRVLVELHARSKVDKKQRAKPAVTATGKATVGK